MRTAATEVASYFEGCTAAKKATIKASGCYKGYREGCHIVGRQLQRFHAVVKAATEVDGCYGGCHIGFCEGCNEALWLMQRLPHRLKADAKAAIKVTGFYKGCHIVEKVATLLKRLCRGYDLDILHKTNPNRGSYEGRDALTLRLRGGAFYEAFDRAFDEAFEEKAGGLL
ncbi:hypothetical protein Tco_1260279 [Tanacetum coccineum]